MKIQCDVCTKDEASVFCSADEAALCAACDHRVHHANKLAGKHQRFSLLHSSPKQATLCDICQEKRGFVFCQQDRAILCSNCDISIHKVNEHTQNHNRFLLPGVKLSSTSALYLSSPSSSSVCDSVPQLKSQSSTKIPISVPPAIPNPPSISNNNNNNNNNNMGNGSTSSISEYLIETLPGWHVEDFLDSSSFIPKIGENEVFLPFWNGDQEGNLGSLSSENRGIWVPQAPPHEHPSQSYPASNMAIGGTINFKEATSKVKSGRKWTDDGGFTVPQITPQSTASKRSRTLW